MFDIIYSTLLTRQRNRKAAIAIFCFMLFMVTAHAQTDITLQDVVMGKVNVVATHSVTLKAGFKTLTGSNFYAAVGSSNNVSPYSSTTVTALSGSNTKTDLSSVTNNYIRTITYREAETSEPSTSFKHMENIQYFDGLGRPIQTVMVGTSPSGKDIIQPVVYDDYGRESIKLLPYLDTKNDGTFRFGITMSDLSKVITFYNTSGNLVGKTTDSKPYSQTVFESSPLNRVLSVTGPGNDWFANSKSVQTNYLANTDDDAIPGWNVTGDYAYSLFTYKAGMLYVNETVDEQGNTTREYKDKQGQVVAKQTKLGSAWLRTSYIYDDLGLLRCMVPPEASDPNADKGMCYYYKYDERNRMVEKKIPSGGTILMVYDKRDRLRFTQNSLQNAVYEWSFTKYDALNRPVMTGTITGTSNTPFTATTLKTSVDDEVTYKLNETRNNTAPTAYDNASYPTTGATVLTATYYDDYDFIDGLNPISGVITIDSLKYSKYENGISIASQLASSNKGRVTGGMSMVLSAPADAAAIPFNKLYNITYYDKYGHVLRTIANNHLGGKDVTSNVYEPITYQVTQTRQEHFKGTEHITLDHFFDYDHTGRLLTTRMAVNSQMPITLNAMQYNEVGEMVTKYLHSAQTSGSLSFVQKMDYQYNIRGWLTQINDPALSSGNDLFGMQLSYNDVTGLGSLAPASGIYNGNIAGIRWNIKGDAAIRGYQFSYDGLNRMLQATYAEGATLNTNTGYFNEAITFYDKNGNIQGLKRYHNNTMVDNLSYTYITSPTKTNQIQSIADAGTLSAAVDDYPGTSGTYTYDVNGNLNHDGSRNMDIYYHQTLNLPQKLDFGNNNRIYYHYLATGNKLVKHTQPASGSGTESYTHYIGNMVYTGGTLSYIISGEGRLVPIGTGSNRKFLYEYNLKDHLGNNRVTFMGTDLGGAIDVVQTTNYYPFGLVMNQTNGTTDPSYTKNKYLYNGKELQDDNLNGTFFGMEDYGARFYDPQAPHFTTIDPMTEKYFSISPYAYCANNPIRYVDPTGMIIEDPDELVKKQKAQLNQNLSYLQNTLKGEGLSEGMVAAINKFACAIQSSLNEISTLENSDQVYSVSYGEGKEGGIRYNKKTGSIDIGIGKSDASIGLIGHELKHAYQYEKGQISIVTDNSGYGKLYDITDETDAYNRERTLGTGIRFFQTPNAVENGYPLQMSDNNVRSWGNSMTPPAYQTLPNGPIDINSKAGKVLRQQTIEAGRAGTQVKEVYKGWQKDYLKGQKN